MARPSKPAEETKRKSVTIRMTDSEYDVLSDYAWKSKKSVTQIIIEGIELVYRNNPVS
ncbi:MAG: CopG family transcriptional regulator [Lachnospiraceae bacterium]|nr:CopG family transcriptional regulator [Lachnospiraceae bacterium]